MDSATTGVVIAVLALAMVLLLALVRLGRDRAVREARERFLMETAQDYRAAWLSATRNRGTSNDNERGGI